MLLNGWTFIDLTTISHYRILHEIKCNSAAQVVRYMKNNIFIGSFNEFLNFSFSLLSFKCFIFLDIFLYKIITTWYSLIAFILFDFTSSNFIYHSNFLALYIYVLSYCWNSSVFFCPPHNVKAFVSLIIEFWTFRMSWLRLPTYANICPEMRWALILSTSNYTAYCASLRAYSYLLRFLRHRARLEKKTLSELFSSIAFE